MKEPSKPDISRKLEIKGSDERPLSPQQKQFNDLIHAIERLRAGIAEERRKYEALSECYQAHIHPAFQQLQRLNLRFAFALDEIALTEKFSRRQMTRIGQCIVGLCDRAFQEFEGSDAERALRERWLEQDQEAKATDAGTFEERFRHLFGDVESALENEEDEPYSEEMAEIRAAQAREQAKKDRQAKRNAEKGPQGKKEAAKKAAEKLKSKSIRSIYVSLAKLLHPDMEPDPDLKEAKQNEMRKAIEAYERDDMATLLHMEMEWIHKQSDHLGALPEEQIQLFVEVLSGQLQELQRERSHLPDESKYAGLTFFAKGKLEAGLRSIKAEAGELARIHKSLSRTIQDFEGPGGKQHALDFVEEFLTEFSLPWNF